MIANLKRYLINLLNSLHLLKVHQNSPGSHVRLQEFVSSIHIVVKLYNILLYVSEQAIVPKYLLPYEISLEIKDKDGLTIIYHHILRFLNHIHIIDFLKTIIPDGKLDKQRHAIKLIKAKLNRLKKHQYQ